MRILPLALVVVLASPSLAQTQDERDYFAERDRAVALAKASSTDPGDVHKRWMPVLEARLRRLIGPGVPKGFDGPSAMSPDALCCFIGKDMLDGIRFTTPDDQGVLVSTEGLLQQWLKLKDSPWWQPSWRARSADPARAFLTGGPYNSSGVGLDTAAVIHALLPIVPPAGAGSTAAALVQETQQPDANFPPKHIALVLFKGGRVYLAQVKATARMVPIAACAAVRAEFDKKAAVASAASDSDKARRIRLEGDIAFEECWTERAKDQPGYAAVVRQAQELADALAAP